MPQTTLSSLQHPLVKHQVKLRENRDYRYKCKRVLLSGKKLIQELSSQWRLRTLLVEEGTEFIANAEQTFFVSKEIIKKVTGLQVPEPVAAEIDMPMPHDLSFANYLLILDGISDPGNLGTLLRTAKALGWEGVYLLTGCTDPFNEKAIRAAKGATFTLPFQSTSWEELALNLKKKKMTILAADTSGENLAKCTLKPPLALALGNEAHGLTQELKNMARLIAIPMDGRMESLNVASAGAILMYELKNE